MANRPAISRQFSDQMTIDIADANMTAVKETLEKFDPAIVTTYPSMALRMAQEEWYLPNLKLVVCMSEPLTPEIRKAVKEAWRDVVVTNHYATGECPILTTACPLGHGAHVNDDVAILAPMDEKGLPCRAGRFTDHVVVTDLLNDVQPIINYRIDDHIRLVSGETACECGSRQPIVCAIEGRQSDYLRLPSGALLTSLQARALVASYPEILDYQFVLGPRAGKWNEDTGLLMNVVLRSPTDHYQDRMKRLSNQLAGMAGCAVGVNTVRFIPVEPKTGKAKRFKDCEVRS